MPGLFLSTLEKNIFNKILLIHAFSGCDTISQLYGIGKTKRIKKFYQFNGMNLRTFLSRQVENSKLFEVSEQMIINSYDLNAKIEKYQLDDFC